MKKLIRKLRLSCKHFFTCLHLCASYKAKRLLRPKAVFLVLTPEHDNLGDHAIAKAETDLFHELGIPYIEITGKQLAALMRAGMLQLMNGRPIFINGGGNLGTLWGDVDRLIQAVIQSNPLSPILVFPSTVFYEHCEGGEHAQQWAAEVYRAHPSLLIYAREQQSYHVLQAMNVPVKIAPDMVLRLNAIHEPAERKGCLICLRSDREKTLSETETAAIESAVREAFGNSVRCLDMERPYAIPVSRREEELEKQLDAFRHAALVITDRLHGMLFAAITGTPCLVVNSKSPKVFGCYGWIRSFPYIRLCDHSEAILSIYNSIPKKEWQYEPGDLLPLFDELKQDILLYSRKDFHVNR